MVLSRRAFSRWLAVVVVAWTLAVGRAQAASPAPDFTLRDLRGQTWHLADLKGYVVVLSFWNNSCAPCKEEMPHLQAVQNEFQAKNLFVLSVNIDDARFTSIVRDYIGSKGYTFPVLLDTSSAAVVKYKVDKVPPYTLVIDRLGNIVWKNAGYGPGVQAELRKAILSVL